MIPQLARIALRPRPVTEVFDLTLVYIRAHLRGFLLLSLWTIGPAFCFSLIVATIVGFSWFAILVPLLLAPLIQAPFLVYGSRLLFSDEATVSDALMETAANAGTILLCYLIQGAVWVSVALCLAGIVMLPFTAYLQEILLLERLNFGKAIGRSITLTSNEIGGTFAAVFGRSFLMVWAALTCEGLGQFVLGFLFQAGAPLGRLWDGQMTAFIIFGILAIQGVTAWYRFMLYIDARTRSEGWDLQVGLRAVGKASERRIGA